MADLEDQIESLKANINYLHENIQDCQQNILQMEQAAGKRTLVSQTDHKNPNCSHDYLPSWPQLDSLNYLEDFFHFATGVNDTSGAP